MQHTWIFDLDNTLHDAGAHVFPHINHSMTRYLMEHLGLDEQAACALRQDYWSRYGATLSGLMRHHDTDPRHFLHHTHQLPRPCDMVLKTPGLRHALRQLQGRKVVFTNAPMAYAEQVLKLLNLRDLFDVVFSIESTRFHPKPSVKGFRHLLRALRTTAARCVLVEDSLPTLWTANKLRMRTVFVTRATKKPSFVTAHIKSVLALPATAPRL